MATLIKTYSPFFVDDGGLNSQTAIEITSLESKKAVTLLGIDGDGARRHVAFKHSLSYEKTKELRDALSLWLEQHS